MAGYQELVTSRRQRAETVAAMKDVLSVMEGIIHDPLVASQRGESYTDDDLDVLREGWWALGKLIDEPQSRQQHLLNEQNLAKGGRGVERAVMMLNRNGFQGVMSAGDTTLEDDAFCEREQRAVEAALEKFDRLTAHGRN